MPDVANKGHTLVQKGPTREWERWAKSRGHNFIVGVDEAGRGPLAGPVVAACCYLPEEHGISGINDSKQLAKEERHRIYQELITHPIVCYAIGVIEAEEIDQINILQATFKAMRMAVAALRVPADFILVDGHMIIPKMDLVQRPIIQGDGICESIAAASIIAKERRDQMMLEHHKNYPVYGFNRHKGYATQEHRKRLIDFGASPIHRKSFDPVKRILRGEKLQTESDLFDKWQST